jgi:2-polyprenyl-3-methyl-5-hydroxy-6-metoxy-1,4-benzoquinol methylase
MRVYLTDHICKRYIERFNPNLESITDINERLMRAKKAIILILSDANYVLDDINGVLLNSKTFDCKIVIRHRRLITIYPNEKIKKAKLKNKKSCKNGSNARTI